MKQCDFTLATDVYDRSRNLKVNRHIVTHKSYGIFCLSLKKLERLLGENGDDPYWKAFLSPLKRYRFELCAAPLFLNKPPSQTLAGIKALKHNVTQCKYLFPQFDEYAQDIVVQIHGLLELNENPLLELLEKEVRNGKGSDAAILLKESYLIPQAEDAMKSRRVMQTLPLLAPVQLRRGKCYNNLFIIGPARWYPDYVYNAPRAFNLNFIRFSWIRDSMRVEPVFIGTQHTGVESDEAASTDTYVTNEEYLLSEEMLPKIDWKSISKKVQGDLLRDAGQDEVDVRLFLLEGDEAVFLDAEENSSVLIIDLDEEANHRVKRVSPNNISPNNYVLLRTSGGGDYIINIADWIMGKEAEGARMTQRLWKNRLREAVKSKSLFEISLKLIDLGSSRANEVNLRNWMSYKSIKTWDYNDFAAIMKLVGLGDKAEECWDIMVMIDIAHRKAGHHIRKLLLRKVFESDLDELQRLGKMEFELSEVDSGSLTAFRVRNISSEVTKVAVSLLGHPFDVKDALWQG